jgi:DNA helicase HerA-like ATPase
MLMIGTVSDGKFNRGINHFPVVGDPVELAEDVDLASIFTASDQPSEQTQDSSDRCTDLRLGRFAPNENHEVKLDGKAFFAKHAAILGSSGSDKSCTVAHLIQQAITTPGDTGDPL